MLSPLIMVNLIITSVRTQAHLHQVNVEEDVRVDLSEVLVALVGQRYKRCEKHQTKMANLNLVI